MFHDHPMWWAGMLWVWLWPWLNGGRNALKRVVRRVDRFQQTHEPFAFAYGVVKKFGDDRGVSSAGSSRSTGSCRSSR